MWLLSTNLLHTRQSQSKKPSVLLLQSKTNQQFMK
jgi:hypothetical protein